MFSVYDSFDLLNPMLCSHFFSLFRLLFIERFFPGLGPVSFLVGFEDSFYLLHFTVGYLRRKAAAFTSFLTHVDVHSQLGIYGLWHLPRLRVLIVTNEELTLRGGECLARVHCIF